MRKITNYTIHKESFEDMLTSGRFNPCLEIVFRDKTGHHTHKLSAGHSDDIVVYREYGETLVLTHNPQLGYFGLEMFNGDEKGADLFLEYHKVIEILGSCDLAPFTLIQRLRNYL